MPTIGVMVGGGFDGAARRGRDVQYAFSSPGTYSHYADIDDLGSYSDTGPAAIQRTSTDSSSSDDDYLAQNQQRDLPAHLSHDYYRDMEETITFDYRSSDRAVTGKHRANQEYYNVLEIASNRLHEDGSVNDYSSGDEGEFSSDKVACSCTTRNNLHLNYSSLRIAVRKKKKRKSKSKKDKRKSRRKAPEKEPHYDEEKTSRSTIFQSLFPPSTMTSRSGDHGNNNLAENEHGDGAFDNDMDPNYDLPTFSSEKSSQWNPAALVTAAHANDKIDRHGFYKNMKEQADLAYGKVQSLKNGRHNAINNEYNLKDIGKMREKKHHSPPRSRNIVWGDESIITKDDTVEHNTDAWKYNRRPDDSVEDSSSSELHQSMACYMDNEKRVEKLMLEHKWRRIGAVLLATIILVGTCLGIYLSLSGRETSPPTSEQFGGNDVNRNDPPPRPLPSPPTSSIDEVASSTSRGVTETELQYIVNTITSNHSLFDDHHSPQSKALRWFQNDMRNYSMTTGARVAQRYALATLYFATNGTGWQTRSQWGSGHECDWYGVGCEAGVNDTVSVTYLDLNSNLLDGTIPPEVGYILSLEQSERPT